MTSFRILAIAFGIGACAAGAEDRGSSVASLAGTSWSIVEIQGEVIPAGEGGRPAELVFLEEARFAGSAGCNRVLGGAAQDGEELRLTPGPMTKMACPEPLASRETSFLAALALVTHHRKNGDALELLAGGRVILRLAPKPATAN